MGLNCDYLDYLRGLLKMKSEMKQSKNLGELIESCKSLVKKSM